jgi:glycosyltransferase involved in cell wall biosynthesis
LPRVFRILATVDPVRNPTASGCPQPSRVTVVIPTYNRAELLAQTLATVFAQQPQPYEVIVVDDGSTDGTREYLESIDASVLRNQAGGWGPARARDEGLKRVRTEFVAFLDSDDLLLPNALARLQRGLEEHLAAPFAFGRCLTAEKPAGRWVPTGLMTVDTEEMEAPLPALFARNFVPSVGTVARSDAVQQIGGYPRNSLFSEDHYFWLRLAQLGDPVFVPLLTAIYRVHPGNRFSALLLNQELDEYLAVADEDPRLEDAKAAHLGVSFCDSFTAAIAQRDLAGAWRAALQTLLVRRRKLRILRSAYGHWRARRRRTEVGTRLWDEDVELRDWLAHH